MSIAPMTIEGIFKSLDDWREERGLQHTVGNITANIGEEIVEYLRAENDYKRVDALCDLCVFSINALWAIEEMSKQGMLVQLSDDYFLGKIDYFPELVGNFSCMFQGEQYFSYCLINIAKYAKYQIQVLGFDFIIAMDETLKEIHSRTGAWNDETQKWEKFRTPEAMALWYEADYSKAKL